MVSLSGLVTQSLTAAESVSELSRAQCRDDDSDQDQQKNDKGDDPAYALFCAGGGVKAGPGSGGTAPYRWDLADDPAVFGERGRTPPAGRGHRWSVYLSLVVGDRVGKILKLDLEHF
jgi:hypothetical protein